MARIPREQILFWWSPTLSELRRCWPELPMNDAIIAIESDEFVLAVLDDDEQSVWVLRP